MPSLPPIRPEDAWQNDVELVGTAQLWQRANGSNYDQIANLNTKAGFQGGFTPVGGDTYSLEGRPDVFSRVSDFAYLPAGSEVALRSEAGCELALPNAAATRALDPAYVPANAVAVEVRGGGPATRQINNFLAADAFEAPVGEVLGWLVAAGAGQFDDVAPGVRSTTARAVARSSSAWPASASSSKSRRIARMRARPASPSSS